MSISDPVRLQEAFTALCTQARLRRRLALEGEAALTDFSLAAGDLHALLAIPSAALEAWANSLLNKRVGELERALPLSLRVAPSLSKRYRRFLSDHPSPISNSVLPPGPREALRALPTLVSELEADAAEAQWAGALLVVETLRAASHIDGAVRYARLGYDLRPVLPELARRLVPTEVARVNLEARFGGQGVQWRAA